MYIKALIDEVQLVQSIYISGEISNFKHYYQSGHMYFTIKDEKSQLKCVMFSSDNSRLRFEPQNGMKVICFGKLGVYERDGVYQLYVRDMQPKGTGELQIAFEQLKQKLEAEGLFDGKHKKHIPKYPEKIGIASSNMGAAKEDMKSVISRRFPLCEVISLHTIVQGENAPADIADSIRRLDKMGVDIIIVGRGGGSIEELWAFNTEEVARAVFECNTPIISAVGHETDYTICDFVADLRAPTPSAAAELAVPDITSERMNINNFEITLESLINNIIVSKKAELDSLIKNSALMDSDKFFDNISAKLNEYDYKMKTAVSSVVTKKESRLLQLASMLNALSPLAIMSRGYAIVSKDKSTVDSAILLKKGETIQIDFSDGEVNAVVSEVKKYE